MMWPNAREQKWHAAMGQWWHCIDALRKFEKRYKSKLLRTTKGKYHDEWEHLKNDCIAAENQVERFKHRHLRHI